MMWTALAIRLFAAINKTISVTFKAVKLEHRVRSPRSPSARAVFLASALETETIVQWISGRACGVIEPRSRAVENAMITLNVNGKPRNLDIADDTPLLWTLRDVLNMTGTKFGC